MFKQCVVGLLSSLLLVPTAFATEDDDLKYFVVQGKPKPEVIKMMVDNPANPWASAEKLVSAIPDAKLVDYYLDVGGAQNLAIIAVPDSKYAAAIVYQRMGSMLMTDMRVIEVLPSSQVAEVMQIAKDMNKADSYQK